MGHQEQFALRILAHGITQWLTLSSSGAYMEVTGGSTMVVAMVRSHAGIVPVQRYTFSQ
jgi:hypothetical protein